MSELEEASKSLEKSKGDEAILVEGSGKGYKWGKKKKKEKSRTAQKFRDGLI
jgi:hypothetical protein